jgi:cell pole-organizing protein PopZ
MGDLSAEPSMEDILASIKRVIKEGESQTPVQRRTAPRPGPSAAPSEEVLELNERLNQQNVIDARPAPPEPIAAEPATAATPTPAVSSATVEATRGALHSLSRLIVKPEPDSDGTLEGLVREMLRPMLSEWLDRNLPPLVEQMVAREIEKITRQG